MAATVFKTPLNNVQTTLASGRSLAGTSLVVATGKGVLFGSPSAGAPVRITVIQAAGISGGILTDPTKAAVYSVTNVTSDTLTIGASPIEGSDLAFSTGDTVAVVLTAGSLSDIHTAVNNIETGTTVIATYALLASPTFTGTPAAPTPSTGDNSTKIATTAFVKAQNYLTTSAVTSVSNSDTTLTISPTSGAVVASLNLGHANSWTAAQTILETVNATSADGLVLSNTTAAANNAQQWAPRVHWIGQGWKTTATAASQTVDWIAELQPVQGSTNPTANLVFSSQVNAGGYTSQVTFASTGSIIGSAGTLTNPTYTFTGTTNTGIYSRSTGIITLSIAGTLDFEFSAAAGFNLASSMPITWGHNGGATTNDVGLSRGGTTSQGGGFLRISNTSTGAVPVIIGGSGASPGTVAVFTVNAQNTVDNTATAQITSTATGNKTLVLQAITSQSVSTLEIQNNGGTAVHAVNAAGLTTTYNGVATAGTGLHATYGYGRFTAQTAAKASVATYTVGAADGSFVVSANINITAGSSFNFTTTVTYTDETNTSQTATFTFTGAGSTTLVTSLTNSLTPTAFSSQPLHIRAKASTAITIATTGTFGTVTYNVEGAISQIA